MIIKLTEPLAPRYIHINSATNKVHLMVPVVGGQEISTDNTCMSGAALQDFFDGGGALRELTAYKESLTFDIALLEPGNAQRIAKEERLAQIEAYIEAASAMRWSYGAAIPGLLARPSNLHSIQLRPHVQDTYSTVSNPVFSINRRNDATGTPLSALYNAMHSTFPSAIIATNAPRTQFTEAVLAALPASATFADIQRILGEQSVAVLGVAIDFTHSTTDIPATKEAIDTLMGFGDEGTPVDYIDALLGLCANNVWETRPSPPFYSIPNIPPENISVASLIAERTEKLSILTQFLLANLNVYCKAKGISTQNFGMVLDASPDLSHDLVGVVSTALTSGDDVERAICNFCNVYPHVFDLARSLNADDLSAIRQLFERNYRTVTATRENLHMDDFMILDKEATGETAKFVTHQGSICVNFAEFINSTAASSNPDYFASVRADFTAHPAEIPPRNESIGEVEVAFEALARLSDEQFARLPEAAKEAYHAHPSFQIRAFLHDVAKGNQEEANAFLMTTPANTQTFLRTPGLFTDYSGRTFNCTAYEYAYWAKDTYMCRMLEAHMDEETKAFMLARIDAIEASGLSFQQNGTEHCSAHFELTALKTALQEYINGYNGWRTATAIDFASIVAAGAASRNIGKAQREVPAHITQEYGRPDRSFDPCPTFTESTLSRGPAIMSKGTIYPRPWFPLGTPTLGVDFFLSRSRYSTINEHYGVSNDLRGLQIDLAAITRLDEVRTADLALSREYLNTSPVSLDLRM